MKKGMGGHQSAAWKNDEWLTPPWILKGLGSFDLDPCAPIKRPWPTAKEHYTIIDNGLMLPWHGRVWLNPPYGRDTEKWLDIMSMHKSGIALIFARTDTEMFQRYVFQLADAVFFIRGRITFCDTDGNPAPHNAGAPSCLVAYGLQNAFILSNTTIPGKFFNIRKGLANVD